MRTKMTQTFPETALERILEALERELIIATDEEILEAAGDLGMKPGMKGSAAFLGLRYPAVDPEWMLRMLTDPQRIWLASSALPGQAEPPRSAPTRPRSRTPKEPTD